MKARLADIRSAGEHEFVYSLTKDSKAWLGKLSKIMLIVSKSSDQMSWVLSGQISQPSLYLKCEIKKKVFGERNIFFAPILMLENILKGQYLTFLIDKFV